MTLQNSRYAPSISRQAFYDAQFLRDSTIKIDILSKMARSETGYDTWFILFFLANLTIIGIETDNTSPEYQILYLLFDALFFCVFLVEFCFRWHPYATIMARWKKMGERDPETANSACLIRSSSLPSLDQEIVGQRSLNSQCSILTQGMPEVRLAWTTSCLSLLTPEQVTERADARRLNPFTKWYWWLRRFFYSDEFTQASLASFDLIMLLINVAAFAFFLSPIVLSSTLHEFTSWRILRVVPVLRVCRYITRFGNLWLLVAGLVRILSSMLWVIFMLIISIYVFALFLTTVASSEPSPETDEKFGSVVRTMYSLFVILTLDSWKKYSESLGSSSINGLILVIYMIVTTFVALYLLIGVMVNEIMRISSSEDMALLRKMRKQKEALITDLYILFSKMDVNGDEILTERELINAMADEEVATLIHTIGIGTEEMLWIFHICDNIGHGFVTSHAFVDSILIFCENDLARSSMQTQYVLVCEFRKFSRNRIRQALVASGIIKIDDETSGNPVLTGTRVADCNPPIQEATVQSSIGTVEHPTHLQLQTELQLDDFKDSLARDIKDIFAQAQHDLLADLS